MSESTNQSTVTTITTVTYPIPVAANLLLFSFALPASLALLWIASHAAWGWALLAAAAFAVVNNTLFALMHEAIHGVLLPNRRWNDRLGLVCGAAFPVPYVGYTYGHGQHHLRNRTDDELFDYYLPHESRWRRNLWLYVGNLGGIYWFLLPLGTVIYFLCPWICRSPRLRAYFSSLGIGAGVGDLAALPPGKTWRQCGFVIAWQVAAFLLLDLSPGGWLLCYWAFALHWSALQYAHHAWSARDVVRGAWNLRVFPPLRLLSLNYHYHLAHHANQQVPWIYLPRFVGADEERPTFWRNYFRLWGGVRPAPPMRIGDG